MPVLTVTAISAAGVPALDPSSTVAQQPPSQTGPESPSLPRPHPLLGQLYNPCPISSLVCVAVLCLFALALHRLLPRRRPFPPSPRISSSTEKTRYTQDTAFLSGLDLRALIDQQRLFQHANAHSHAGFLREKSALAIRMTDKDRSRGPGETSLDVSAHEVRGGGSGAAETEGTYSGDAPTAATYATHTSGEHSGDTLVGHEDDHGQRGQQEQQQQQQHPWLRLIKARPPPPPPLTPPQPSHAVFTLEHPARPTSESNPFFVSTSSPSSGTLSTASSSSYRPTPSDQSQVPQPHDGPSPATARRRSYTKTLPIGIPPSIPIPMGMPMVPHPTMGTPTQLVFPPASFPSSAPMLPPPMPGIGMDMQGEIISVTDEAGQGWKRHTRVYGGGVCLACAAAARDGLGGGFYGRTVRPEEMR